MSATLLQLLEQAHPGRSQGDLLAMLDNIPDRKNKSEAPQKPARSRAGSRPRTDASMERRRSWAASGLLPPRLAFRFTLAEQAVLAVVASEVGKSEMISDLGGGKSGTVPDTGVDKSFTAKDLAGGKVPTVGKSEIVADLGACTLTLDHIAALAGVCRTSVRNALREAQALGFIRVEERRLSAWRNAPNRVTITSPEWLSWLKLRTSRRRDVSKGGGVKSVHPTNTDRKKEGFRRAEKAESVARNRLSWRNGASETG